MNFGELIMLHDHAKLSLADPPARPLALYLQITVTQARSCSAKLSVSQGWGQMPDICSCE